VIVIEVIVEQLNRPWWTAYKHELAERFRQETLLVRAMAVDLL
jgi:hypothetical protein